MIKCISLFFSPVNEKVVEKFVSAGEARLLLGAGLNDRDVLVVPY